jgi:hypothetical protein
MARVQFSPVPPSFAGVDPWTRIAEFQSADGSSTLLAGTNIPFVQWIRIERYERSDSGSSPERDTRFYEVVAERQRHLTVDEDGSKFDVRLDGSGPVTELA